MTEHEPTDVGVGATCPNCGAPLHEDWLYCAACGAPTSALEATPAEPPEEGE